MSTITLDTFKTVQKLRTKGFTAEQAEGIVSALTESEIVTKSDLKVSVADLKVWVALMLLAQGSLIVTLQTLLS